VVVVNTENKAMVVVAEEILNAARVKINY